jgi:hypothetical protein
MRELLSGLLLLAGCPRPARTTVPPAAAPVFDCLRLLAADLGLPPDVERYSERELRVEDGVSVTDTLRAKLVVLPDEPATRICFASREVSRRQPCDLGDNCDALTTGSGQDVLALVADGPEPRILDRRIFNHESSGLARTYAPDWKIVKLAADRDALVVSVREEAGAAIRVRTIWLVAAEDSLVELFAYRHGTEESEITFFVLDEGGESPRPIRFTLTPAEGQPEDDLCRWSEAYVCENDLLERMKIEE